MSSKYLNLSWRESTPSITRKTKNNDSYYESSLSIIKYFSKLINYPFNKNTSIKTTLIRYTDKLLTECGNDTWPEFFKEPEEPAKRTVDDGNYTDWIGYGDISMSPYDTAWLAMVPSKTYKESGSAADFELAFPQCFTWLLEYQESSGSWSGTGPGSIAPALSGLLALGLFHSRSGRYFEDNLQELGFSLGQYNNAFQMTIDYLRVTLNDWNIDDLDMVGFELIIPYHLDALEKLEPSISFDFPDKARLLEENQRKMSIIPLEAIFALAAKKQPITIVHSIEAFCNTFEMSRVQNEGFQAINGCYGSSPAATAAVLIHASRWDDKGYEFLKKILERRPSYSETHGCVPTLCDVGIFETAWVTHSLSGIMLNLSEGNGFKRNKSGVKQLLEKNNAFIEYLQALLKEANGKLRWVSWDNRIPADVDDTAVARWLIRQFDANSECDLDLLIRSFYNGKYFITFPVERTFSISCNAHALSLLILEYEKAKIKGIESMSFPVMTKSGIAQKVKLEEMIVSVADFIIEKRSKYSIWTDKWNKSPGYPTFKAIDILLSLTHHPEFLNALTSLDSSGLLKFCRETVEWTLKTQHEDGSWGEPSKNAMGNLEETSYFVRLLKTSSIYYTGDKSIRKSISKGQEYLKNHLDEAMNTPGYFHNSEPYLWINKQLYTMPRVIKSSMIAALWEN
ncbi:7292_t:CDS:2 [Funneliformis mosseae]|uniref:7292_t:CDS:1 n=1 Tax=Funneliformis mosseae TaxID=27381 RepID=A0A9N9B323_FUNMO|nr:7292_t:CDS:2 [Funneliformis mosseae]